MTIKIKLLGKVEDVIMPHHCHTGWPNQKRRTNFFYPLAKNELHSRRPYTHREAILFPIRQIYRAISILQGQAQDQGQDCRVRARCDLDLHRLSIIPILKLQIIGRMVPSLSPFSSFVCFKLNFISWAKKKLNFISVFSQYQNLESFSDAYLTMFPNLITCQLIHFIPPSKVFLLFLRAL